MDYTSLMNIVVSVKEKFGWLSQKFGGLSQTFDELSQTTIAKNVRSSTAATARAAKRLLQKRKKNMMTFFSRPGLALIVLIVDIIIMWLSTKQVRATFRLLAYFQLAELINLRRLLEPNIYLVVVVMILAFVWLDTIMMNIGVTLLKSSMRKSFPKRLDRYLGVFEGGQDARLPAQNMHLADIQQALAGNIQPRRNPPRACRKNLCYFPRVRRAQMAGTN